MKRWQGLLSLLVLIIWTTGCKTPHRTEALERELRYQEDMIYQLQDYIQTYKSYLAECRQENQACQKKSVALGESSSRSGHKNDGGGVKLVPPSIKLPDGFKGPEIELPGSEQGSKNQLRAHPFSDNSIAEQLIGSQWNSPLPDQVTLARYQESVLKDPAVPTPLADGERPLDPIVASLALGQDKVGAYAGESDSGGIWILLEPRNAANQIVSPIGELSIAVLNPSAYTEKQARISNWKFSPEQMGMISKGLPPGEGLLLELPWVGKPPEQKLLHLYLRLITPDGNRLVVDQAIDLSQDPLDRRSGSGSRDHDETGWTKRTRARPRVFTAVIPNGGAVPNSHQENTTTSENTKTSGRVVPTATAEKIESGSPWTRRSIQRRRPEWKPYR